MTWKDFLDEEQAAYEKARPHELERMGRQLFSNQGQQQESCEACEGDGSYNDFADCTTFDKDCACNGPRVTVDPCPYCKGTGNKPQPDGAA